jgi:hypothetical protein
MAATSVVALVGLAAAPAAADEVRSIHFPVEGTVWFTDTFGAPRPGGTHQGQDLMGTKLQHELAATDGYVSYTKVSPTGNMLVVKDSAGWEYWYIHINNDTPGTDDGLNPPQWIFAPGITRGSTVYRGQFVAYMGDSGDAESTAPHLHFEIHRPDGTPINPYESLLAADHGPGNPHWLLRDTATTGTPDHTLGYGDPGDEPMVCDIDGNGTDALAVHRVNRFYLAASLSSSVADATGFLGDPGDVPLCGDWDGNATDTVGIFRRGLFALSNTDGGTVDQQFGFGDPGDVPVVGDGDGDGVDTVGVFRAGRFYLSYTPATGIGEITFGYGDPGDRPVVGDWHGDGIDTVSIMRGDRWYLSSNPYSGVADTVFAYGLPTDTPLVGDWDGDGRDAIGVYRPSQ